MFHKTSFRANQEFCKAFAAANVNPGRFTERSGGDASDTDGQPARASKRERTSQTPYNDHRNWFAVTRLTYVMAPTPCAPASLALLF